MSQEYFIGIDLGTTNSLMAWSRVDSNEKLRTEIVDISMIDESGGKIKNDRLPSVLYFGKDLPIIGNYAKNMIVTRPDLVLKSVKSYMGEGKVFEFNQKQYKTSDIQSFLLKQMSISAKELFGFIPQDVIITVPASFDSDMRRETLEAAKKAGFLVEKSDGSYKNILLDEPRAVIFDFINKHQNGEIPESLIDLNESKNVLVFDLGGGTLDVSIHKIHYDGKIKIEDYAVSRYTRLGGDNFDKLVAQRLMEIYLDENSIERSSLEDIEKNKLEKQFLQIAEEVKIELSKKIENNEIFGLDRKNVCYEILKGNLYDGKIFNYDISINEYKQIISPLLADHLEFDDYKNIENIKDVDNIIYPILDVLNKCYERLGTVPKIDAVILNGGMTKLQLIKERIKEFFGFEPLTVTDPDKSVARGASVFHYYIHRGYKATKIMNDTIGIKLVDGTVKHLITQGTVLPYKSKEIDEFKVEKEGSTHIDLPFYMGSRRDTQPPNRRIATRRINFEKGLSTTDKISISVEVDEIGLMKVNVKLNGDESNVYQVQILTGIDEESQVKEIKQNTQRIYVKKPKGNVLPKKSTIDFYIRKLSELDYCYDVYRRGYLMKDIKDLEKQILNAQNYKEFVPILLNKLSTTKKTGFTRIVQLLGNIMDYYNYSDKEILSKLMYYSSPMTLAFKSELEMNTKIRTCIEAIGKSKDNSVEQHIINVISSTNNLSVINSALISLGKVGYSMNSIKLLEKMIYSNFKINTFWALGKIASRENNKDLKFNDIKYLESKLFKVIKQLRSPEEVNNLLYTFVQIFDDRNESNLDSNQREQFIIKLDHYISEVRTNLNFNHSQESTFKNRWNVCTKMIQGTKLTTEEYEVLLALRKQ